MFHCIEKKAGIASNELRLVHEDTELEKGKDTMISDYSHIKKDDIVFAIFRQAEEEGKEEKTLASKVGSQSLCAQECPGCQTLLERKAKKLICGVCKRESCCLCLQEWKSWDSDACGNEDCHGEDLFDDDSVWTDDQVWNHVYYVQYFTIIATNVAMNNLLCLYVHF